MKFSETNVIATPEVLKRKLGGEYFAPISLHASALANGKCPAGTPIDADGKIADVTGGTKGTWTVAISTAFAEDETIVINGVTYTCGSEQSADNKVFAGANAGAQATSLVAIVADANFTLTNSTGTITFTQKKADASGSAPVVTTTATTGAIGTVTAGTSAVDGTSNAVGILLNDVYEENPNGSLIKAFAVINSANSSATASDKAKLSLLCFE